MKKIVVVALVVFAFNFAFAQVNVTLGPYLQSPTKNSIKIMWRTDSTTVPNVMFGTSPGNLNQTMTGGGPGTIHMVQLTGLLPYTKYYYAIYDGSTLLEGGDNNHWFRTFPDSGVDVPFRTWAIGDFGKANEKQRRVRDAYLNFDTVETNVWLWLGDNAYNDGTLQEYVDKVFDPVAAYGKNMKYMPFEPSPGNHDYNSVSPILNPKPPLQHAGPYFDLVEVYKNAEAGGVATNHELFYSFDYANAHFVSLNSEVGAVFGTAADDWTGARKFLFGGSFTSSPLTTWLHADLAANTKPWVIVYLHQPPYTDGSHESTTWYEVYMRAVREHLAPIWEQYGVDIVLCGHTHVYERSFLVHGNYSNDPGDINFTNFIQNNSGNDSLGEAYMKYTQGPTPNRGTVYVNNGNSGSDETGAGFSHPYMYSEYGCDTCCGSFVMDINGNRLDGRHVDMNGVVRDHFTIYKINGAPSSINENGANDLVNNFRVIPNPFKNSTAVSFDLKNRGEIKIQLADVSGKLVDVFSGQLESGFHTYEIDANQLQLAKGVYVLRITGGDKNAAKTVIRIE